MPRYDNWRTEAEWQGERLAFRHNCRDAATWDKTHRNTFLVNVAKKRGKPAAQKIWDELQRRRKGE